ncbi:MAG: hypothetical protein ACLU7E_19550 [Clostridium butyricum]
MINKRRKVKLNVKFNKNEVVCARSPRECEGCTEMCELMDFYYYPYKGWQQCFNNSEKRK